MSNWLDLSNVSNLYIQSYVKGFVDISGGNLILRNNGINVLAGDISLNGRLLIQSDLSSNGRLFLANDASLGGRLFVASDVSINGNLRANYPASSIPPSAIIGGVATNYYTTDVSMTQRLFVGGDASFGSRVFALGDVSFGGQLFVVGDSSINGNLTVGKALSVPTIDGNPIFTGAPTMTTSPATGDNSTAVATTAFVKAQGYLTGLGSAALLNASNTGSLAVTGDLSTNRLFAVADASLGGRLFVVGDASINGNVVIGKDITILGNLVVQQMTNSAIINTTTTNVFNVSEDLSLNGRIMSGSDASFGGNLNVVKAATFGTTTTSTGLLTASNGFTLASGTLTLPAESIADAAHSANIVTLTGGQTLTNKTLTAPIISSISNGGTVTIPTGTNTLATVSNLSSYAPLSNPIFTGLITANAGITIAAGQSLSVPTISGNPTFSGAPTLTASPATGDSSTAIATTAFVKGQNYLTSLTGAALVNISNAGSIITSSDLSSNRLFTVADASLGGRLFVVADVSMNGNLTLGKTLAVPTISGNPTFSGAPTLTASPATGDSSTAIATTAFVKGQNYLTSLTGAALVNISNAGSIITSSDLSSNRLFTVADASLGGRLFVVADVSMNGNVTIGKNVVILGNLSVQAFTNNSIINTVTTNVFNVSEDLSLNGRIMTSSDASFSGNLNVGKSSTFVGPVTFQSSSLTFQNASIPTAALIGTLGNNNSFTGDVSMSNSLFVTNDISCGGHFTVVKDTSMNGNLQLMNTSVWQF